ncbi:MAG: 50S ribosomal protein L18 [Bradymonadaceae bacterium]
MLSKREREDNRLRRKRRIRKKVMGTPRRPRLSVFKSNKHIYAQIIDDYAGHTLVSASTVADLDDEVDEMTKSEQAREVGELLAERAIDEGIEKVVFDRNGFIYHGRLAKVADGARDGGLDF